jgi:hypothetical protein
MEISVFGTQTASRFVLVLQQCMWEETLRSGNLGYEPRSAGDQLCDLQLDPSLSMPQNTNLPD